MSCPTQVGWLGTRRPRLPVRPRPRLGPQEVFSSNLLSPDTHLRHSIPLRGMVLSLLPGLEKCCGLTPPFDDLAMDHTNDRCAVPPPLGGDSTATAYCLQKDHRIIYRSQCANLSFFHYLIAHSLYNGFRLKSRVKPGEMQLVAKMLLSRKWSGREKEESKVPPKIDHPPTAATGEITKCRRRLMTGGEGCVGR